MFGSKIIKKIMKIVVSMIILYLLFSLTIEVKATEILTPEALDSSWEWEREISSDIKEYMGIYAIILVLAIINILIIVINKKQFKLNKKYLKILKLIEIVLMILPILILAISILIGDIDIYDILNLSDIMHRIPISLIIEEGLLLFQIILFVINSILTTRNFIIYKKLNK